MEYDKDLTQNFEEYKTPMPKDLPAWGEYRIGNLLRLRALGYSLAQMGAELGCSRSAIAGIVFRLGLSRHQHRAKVTPEEVRHRRSAAQKHRALVNRTRVKGTGTPSSGPSLTDLPVTVGDAPTDILGLKNHHCRWPIEGRGASMLYCGGNQEKDSSYCTRHAELSRPRA